MRRSAAPWLFLAVLVVLSVACAHTQRLEAASVGAATIGEGRPAVAHVPLVAVGAAQIRPLDVSSRIFLEEGLRRSVTFRYLVEAIDRSDVLVYVETTTNRSRNPSAGTTFVSFTGPSRVLKVRLQVGPDWPQGVRLLGHELQHVVEVAQAPEVVDLGGYGRLFRAIGRRSSCPTRATACFETEAALAVGRFIARDLSAKPGSGRGPAALRAQAAGR